MAWLRTRFVSAMLAVTALFPNMSKIAFFARTPAGVATEAAAVAETTAAVVTTVETGASAGATGALIATGAVAGGGAVAATTTRGCGILGRSATNATKAAGRAERTLLVEAEIAMSRRSGVYGNRFTDVTAGERFMIAEGRTVPMIVATDGGRTAAATAVHSEPIVLFDGAGRAVKGVTSERAIFEERLIRIARDAAAELPKGGAELTDAQLRQAIAAALKREPKLRYNLDVTTGKLTLKVKTLRGDISGEVNAYSVVKRTATMAATGYGGYVAWQQQLNNR